MRIVEENWKVLASLFSAGWQQHAGSHSSHPSENGRGRAWTNTVAGKFSTSLYDSLLFEQSTGYAVMRSSSRKFRTRYCSFMYSTLASFRMGMSGSASFQSVRKSL